MATKKAVKPRMIQADDEQWKAVRNAAWKERVSMAEIVRRALTAYLPKRRAK